jgi:phosphoserine phosphatase
MNYFTKGGLGCEEILRAQFLLVTGMRAHEITPHVMDLPLVARRSSIIERLKLMGVKALILTDNASFIVAPLRICGFQEVIGSEIEIQGGIITDRMKLLTNKLRPLREYC